MSKKTVLTTLDEKFDVNRVIVSKATAHDIPNSNNLKYFRVYISYDNADGSQGNFVFATPRESFTSGIVSNKNESDTTTGFSMPISLMGKDGYTQEQKNFISAIKKIVKHVGDKCKSPDVRKVIKNSNHDASIASMNPLKVRMNDEGEVDESRGTSMYIKIYVKRDGSDLKVLTPLYKKDAFNPDGTPATYDISEVLGAYALVYGAVRLESVYFGSGRASLQFKLVEVDMELLNGTRQRFIRHNQERSTPVVRAKSDGAEELVLSDDD